ncbi:helix-turn-helix domain-containing protein [Taibaiella chishuiensis]|uniref:AraC-like DNA-binding protein n=1 Tax=Taibaiella chishuiensis TaxID=1434707 RepID=A0A2P8D8G7_9BACT|nr:AraC family transcriptional regulator [Taibaiella chishuiensis]PSK93525.1 AraC-like DNA-binding protein [Taibaiella chishuiensis]
MVQFLSIKSIQERIRMDEDLRVYDIAIVEDVHKIEDGYTDFEHQFDGLILSFCIAGSMGLKINFNNYEISSGAMVVVLPQLIIDPVHVSEDLRLVSLVMSLDFISSFPVLRDFITNDELRRRPVINAEEQQHGLFEALVSLLQKHYRDRMKETGNKKKVLQYLVFALISAIADTYAILPRQPVAEGSRKSEVIDAFYSLISQHAHRERTVAYYARQLNLSQQYLTSLVKEQTGKPVSLWIEHVVIMHAKSLLKSTTLSVKEICQELNFADVSLFCRYFKRCTQLTPGAFRNKAR